MQALGRYYEYLVYGEATAERIEDKKEFENKIYPYVDRIAEVFSDLENLERIYKQATEIINELGYNWRKSFINYLEPIRRTPESKIEIPEEAKKKIGKTISEAFEKEIKRK